MSRKSVSPHKRLVTAFALIGAFGCKQEEPNIPANEYPQHMAFGYCEAVYNCPCENYPYTNFNECYGDLLGDYDEVNDEAYLAGLTYDGSCPAKELQQLDQLACKNWLPDTSGVCVRPCNAWYGPLGAGQVCTVVASAPEIGVFFSTCAQGLTCFAGVCVDLCQINVLPDVGQPCPDLVCKAGAMCDENQICVAIPTLPGPAESCANGLCDPDRAVCVTDANVCAALPSAGQPCVQNQPATALTESPPRPDPAPRPQTAEAPHSTPPTTPGPFATPRTSPTYSSPPRSVESAAADQSSPGTLTTATRAQKRWPLIRSARTISTGAKGPS